MSSAREAEKKKARLEEAKNRLNHQTTTTSVKSQEAEDAVLVVDPEIRRELIKGFRAQERA